MSYQVNITDEADRDLRAIFEYIAFEQKEKRDADQRATAEANELPFRQIEKHLAFHL